MYVESETALITLPFGFSNGCIAQTDDETMYIFGGKTETHSTSQIIKIINATLQETLDMTTPTPLLCYQNKVYSFTQNKIYIFVPFKI